MNELSKYSWVGISLTSIYLTGLYHYVTILLMFITDLLKVHNVEISVGRPRVYMGAYGVEQAE